MTQNLLAEIFSLSETLVKLAHKTSTTLATAESCTGGLIGAAITSTPGSSSVFYGGIIAYHNDVKINQLGVAQSILDQYGAVSESVAKQMAQGCRDRLGVDIAVSVTGVAGPNGGSIEKPVGTVWIGIATRHVTRAELYSFPNLSRNKVRDHTCLAALRTFHDILI